LFAEYSKLDVLSKNRCLNG
jgi:hypothetical protein